MKLTQEEAWEYVLENQNLIWAKIHSYNMYNKEDCFQEAIIEAMIRVMADGVDRFPSIVRSVVCDFMKHKNQRTNASDFKHMEVRGVLAC